MNPAPADSRMSRMVIGEAARAALEVRVVAERVLGLRHADREMPEPEVLVQLEGLLGGRQQLDPVGPVDLRRDRENLLAEGSLVRVEELELRPLDAAAQTASARSVAPRPPSVKWVATTAADAPAAIATSLIASTSPGVSVGNELITTRRERRRGGRSRSAWRGFRRRPDGLDVLLEEHRIERLAGDDPADAAVHLQGPNRGHDDGRVRCQAGGAALDVEEFLGAHVGAEARFGADNLVGGQGEAVSDDRVVAGGDVGEWPAMDERRPGLECLEEVRLDRVDEKDRHRTGNADVLAGHRLAVDLGREHDPAETRPEVMEVGCEREDRHHLRADRDDPFGLAGDAVLLAAKADDRSSNRAVADVDDRGQRIENGSIPSGFL